MPTRPLWGGDGHHLCDAAGHAPGTYLFWRHFFFLGAVSLLTICFWPVMEKSQKEQPFSAAPFFSFCATHRGLWGFERMVGPALPEMLTHFGLFSAFGGSHQGTFIQRIIFL